MTLTLRLTLFALLLLGCVLPGAAQTYLAKNIHFAGDTGYSDTELMAAANLKIGVALTNEQMNDHAKLLMDSGLFQDISFQFNGQDLVFTLTPVKDLYPIRLENLPVTIAAGLDGRLRARFPLFRGKVPSTGALMDGVKKELQEELSASGIKASLEATPYTGLSMNKVTAMSFSITEPAVEVGQIQLQGSSPALAEKAKATLSRSSGTPYSVDGSVSQLQNNLTVFYTEQGYLEVNVKAVAQPNAVIESSEVQIPFLVSVEEGSQYKLAAVTLAPGVIATQAEFDNLSELHPGDVVSLVKLRADLLLLGRLYHNHGYMRAEIHSKPSLDRVTATASYNVTADPGPVYTTGKVQVDNVNDVVRSAVLSALKLPPGEPFNEGAIRGMMATHGVNPAFERIVSLYKLSYKLQLHDDAHVVDVAIDLEPKHP